MMSNTDRFRWGKPKDSDCYKNGGRLDEHLGNRCLRNVMKRDRLDKSVSWQISLASCCEQMSIDSALCVFVMCVTV
jgi:hypothetical protein